jgi:hypothetical protein
MKNKLSRDERIQRATRGWIGTLLLIGVLLTICVHPLWIILPGLISLGLLQSAFTGFCPPQIIASKVIKK